MVLRGIDIFSREITLSNLILSSSEKGSTLKGKNLLPVGANSFLLEETLFGMGLSTRKQPGSHRSYLPCEEWQKIYHVYLVPFKLCTLTHLCQVNSSSTLF